MKTVQEIQEALVPVGLGHLSAWLIDCDLYCFGHNSDRVRVYINPITEKTEVWMKVEKQDPGTVYKFNSFEAAVYFLSVSLNPKQFEQTRLDLS